MRWLVSAAFPWTVDLLRRLEPEEVIGLMPPVTAALAGADLPAQDISAYAEPADLIEAGRYARRAILELGDVEDPMADLLACSLPRLAAVACSLDRAGPDAILLHNDVEPLPRLCGLWARARGKPAFHIPHAVYLDETWRGRMGEDVHDLVAATHLGAACRYQAEWYRARSADLIIEVTGAPRLDWLADWRPRPRDPSRRLLGLGPDDFLVVYATSWGQATSARGAAVDPFEYYRRFLESARRWERRGVVILVKLHPGQADGARYFDELRESGLKGMFTAQHLPHVLKAADRLVSFTASNICLEAAALGVPVLVHGTRPPWDGAYALDEVSWADVAGATIPELEAFLEPLGGSADRVARWIRAHFDRGDGPQAMDRVPHRQEPAAGGG